MHMTHGKVVSLLGAVAVAGLSLLGTTAAEAHGRGGRVVIRGGFGGWHGFGPYGWYGFNRSSRSFGARTITSQAICRHS